MHAASLPYLRRVSEARRAGVMPLLGFGHGQGFLQPGGENTTSSLNSKGTCTGATPLGSPPSRTFGPPGGDTSMAHDAPVLAYDGSGVGRQFNLLCIDEEAECAVTLPLPLPLPLPLYP